MDRYVCIHGHFYQPPRENAWLESVEVQPTAYPYHDWNERVTAECYWPNCASQILDSQNRIVQIVNNYAKISFDFGPTLLSWLEAKAPEVYQCVLEADRESRKLFGGHGSAIAQPYNHLIMPLATQRDKYTQVIWGIRDFEHRFGRSPEGMWLPETAVDLATLDYMAGQGITFTILAPDQALRVRKLADGDWTDVRDGKIDFSLPYEVHLPSNRKINVFFYNGPLSHAVAFRSMLRSGEDFAHKLVDLVPENIDKPRLAHIATDGESYGHHHRFGDMALSYTIHHIEETNLARLTNYGQFLEIAPPEHEVELVENSSWSCVHGVERWRSDCGCSDHFHSGWNQAWRAPLRKAMDWLRDDVAPRFEKKAQSIFKDPWQARNAYIQVVLDRSPGNVESFLSVHVNHPLTADEKVSSLKLLELQRHAMLMYTSCGWFFDDLARIETVQTIHYAGRVAQLSGELFGDSPETRFIERLAKAKSNREDYGDGRQIYERFVRPVITDLKQTAAHFVVSSSLSRHTPEERVYCYQVHTRVRERFFCGKMDVDLGVLTITSEITLESMDVDFLLLSRNGSGIKAGLKRSLSQREYERAVEEISAACSMDDTARLEQYLENQYPGSIFTVNSLFRDAQYLNLEKAVKTTVAELIPLSYPGLHKYAAGTPLVNDIDNPLPETFRPLVELILNHDLERRLVMDNPDREIIQRMLDDARLWHITLEIERLAYVFSQSLEEKMRQFLSRLDDTVFLDRIITLVQFAHSLPIPVTLHKVQYYYYRELKDRFQRYKAFGAKPEIKGWMDKCEKLGDILGVKL